MSGPMFLYPESCRQPSRHLATYHRSTDASTRPTGAPESRRLSRGGDQGSKLRPPSTDVNGAPLTRTPPRQSWGRGPSPLGVAANTGPLVDVSFTASCAAPTGRVPGIRGAFIIVSTPCSCVGVGDQHSGIVRLFEVV